MRALLGLPIFLLALGVLKVALLIGGEDLSESFLRHLHEQLEQLEEIE